MEITKYLHSCLLVEIEGKTILFDPGNYTEQAGVLNLESLGKLDYLLITHEHPDHMSLPLIKKIVEKFPEVKVISNSSIQAILEKEGIKASSEETDFIKMELVPHERMYEGEPPLNILFKVGDIFSHPGDSHHFKSTTKVLALPVQAPWGSFTDALNLAVAIKPETVVPIHDFHWSEESRESFYQRSEDFLGKHGIKFISLQTGEKVTI